MRDHVSRRLNADLMDRWNGSVPPSTADPGEQNSWTENRTLHAFTCRSVSQHKRRDMNHIA